MALTEAQRTEIREVVESYIDKLLNIGKVGRGRDLIMVQGKKGVAQHPYIVADVSKIQGSSVSKDIVFLTQRGEDLIGEAKSFVPPCDERESAEFGALLASPTQAIEPQAIEPLVRVIARAVEVLGTSEKALRWLNAPVRSLGDQAPASLLNSPEGIASVEDALGRIEHGVW